jgi:hypothetical protein
MLSVNYPELHFNGYAECRYAQCHGAISSTNVKMLSVRVKVLRRMEG